MSTQRLLKNQRIVSSAIDVAVIVLLFSFCPLWVLVVAAAYGAWCYHDGWYRAHLRTLIKQGK